jgi:hypothetical protein
MTLDKDTIKQLYLSCSMKNKDGLYADEVDLLEFSAALVHHIAPAIAYAEREACITFVASRNKDLAQALADKRKGT